MSIAYAGVLLIAMGAHIGVSLIQVGFVFLLAGWLQQRAWADLDRRLLAAVGLFVGLAILHSLIGTMEVSNLGYALRWRFLLILVLVPTLLNAEQRAASRQALLLLTGLAGLYGLAQVALNQPGWLTLLPGDQRPPMRRFGYALVGSFWWGRHYATGMIHNIPAFAHTSALVLLWPAAVWIIGRRKLRPWMVAAFCLGIVGLAGSGSRGGPMALIVGLGALVGLRLFWRWRRTLALSAVLGLIVVGSSFVWMTGQAQDGQNLAGRDAIWKQCKVTLAESFPAGLGYGNHPARAQATYDQDPGLAKAMRTWCHNMQFSLAVEAPGCLLALLVLLMVLIRRLTAAEEPDAETAFSLAALIAFMAIAQVHDPHFQREFFPLALLIIALGLGKSVCFAEPADCKGSHP